MFGTAMCKASMLLLPYSVLLVVIPNYVFVNCWTINTLISFDSLHENNSLFTQKQLDYLVDVADEGKYPIIENLNNFIIQLAASGNRNCFVVIDNFQNINFNSMVYPLVLRRPIPIIHQGSPVGDEIVLGPATKYLQNLSVSVRVRDDASFKCPLSKIFIGYEYGSDTCLRINLAVFLRYSKPLNCHVHVGIFPPPFVMSNLLYPRIFKFKLKHLSSPLAASSSVPPINVMLLGSLKAEILMELSTNYWINNGKNVMPSKYYHDTFLVISVEVKYAQQNTLQLEPIGDLAIINILKVCHACEDKHLDGFGTINLIPIPIHNFGDIKLEELAYSLPSERIMWYSNLIDSGAARNLLGVIIQNLVSCPEKSYTRFWSNIRSKCSAIDKVAIAHAEVWKSIMGNYSIFSRKTSNECASFRSSFFTIILDQQDYARSLFYFPYYTTDYLNSFRFIGCGSKGLSSIQFQELTNVYDNLTWFCIVVTILLAPLSMKLLYKHAKISDNVISILKLLLEQDDPFLPSVTRVTGYRYVIALLLLMGIILSDAYKNTNVYNMILPRRPLPYKYFEEVESDNYKIYSRVSDIHPFSRIQYDDDKIEQRLDGFPFKVKRGTYFVLPEIQSFLENHEMVVEYSGGRESQDQHRISMRIRNAVKIHPGLVQNISKELLNADVINPYDLDATNLAIQEEERRLLLRSLKECRKEAAVLPDHMCREFYYALTRDKSQPKLFIGKEVYYFVDWLFHLNGLVPLFLIRRIHGIAESGVWKWWMDLLSGNVVMTEEAVDDNQVEAATIDGNIVIIFVVWICGIALGVMGFIGEHFALLLIKVLKYKNTLI